MGNKTKPTLRSRSTARALDVISEGEIWGLINGDKSIYLDGTQLQNNNGSYNFRGVRTSERKGTVNQNVVPGFRNVTSEVNDGRQISNGTPLTFTVSDVDIDAVDIKFRVNSLFETTNKGKMKSTAVELQVERQSGSGAFTTVGTVRIKGRTTSAYDRHKRIELPEGGHPYTIRVRRNTNNNTDPQKQNDTYLATYTLITDLKLFYPYTALIGLEVDAQKFGSQFPERVYEVGGILIDYPSNYNPNTRVYTGVWNGTFTRGQRCDNPAWVLWDLQTKNRYGLGHVFNGNNVDKWTLYNIAKYCDELVPDGNGGMEPRYTFNGVIETREDASKLLDRITSIFRGMMYWQAGSVTFTHDAPITETPKIVTRANVIGGKFSYSMAAKKTRFNAVTVAYNDPAKLGEVNFEYVEHGELIEKYGYQPTELAAFACTSPGQAHRHGEWLIDTDQNEPDLVSYRAGLDHMDVRPGKLIAIYDPWYAGARMGGRVLEYTGTQIRLDAPYNSATGFLRVTLPDGTVQERNIIASAGNYVTINTPLPDEPIVGALYGIANSNINPRLFKVVAVSKKSDAQFEISALLYDATKFARVERNVKITPPSYTAYDANTLVAPTLLNITETRSDNGDEYAPSAVLSWVPAVDARVSSYGVQVFDADDADWQDEVIVAGNSFSYDETPLGALKFRVRSIGDGPSSAYVESAVFTIVGYPLPTAYTDLIAVGKFRKIVLKFASNSDVKFRRAIIYGSSDNNFANASIIGYAPDGDKRWVEEDLGKKVSRFYWIAAEDKYGRISTRYPNTVQGIQGDTIPIDDIDTSDDPLAAPTNLTLVKVQDNDADGPVKTHVLMDCTPPAWAAGNDKVSYTYLVTVNGKTFSKTSKKNTTAKFIVHNVGDQHSVVVFASKGHGKPSDNSPPQLITPGKKANNLPALAGMTVHMAAKGVRARWTDPDISDLRWVLIYRNTANNSGGAQLVGRTKSDTWRDDDENLVIGQRYYYWGKLVDNSGNISNNFSNSDFVDFTGISDDDLDPTPPGTPSIPSLTKLTADADGDGKQEAYLVAAWAQGSGPDPKSYTLEVYRTPADAPGAYNLWDEFEVDGSKLQKRFRANTLFLHKARVKARGGVKGLASGFSNLTAVGVQPDKKPFGLALGSVNVVFKSYRKKHVITVTNAPVDDPEFAYLEIKDRTSGAVVYRGRGDEYVRANPPSTVGYSVRVFDNVKTPSGVFNSPGSGPSAGNDGVDDIIASDLSAGCVKTVKLEDAAVTAPKLAHNIVEADDKELGATSTNNIVIDIQFEHGDADHVCVWAQFINKEGSQRSNVDVNLERSGGPTFASINGIIIDDDEIVPIFGRIGRSSLSPSGTSTVQLRCSGAFLRGDRKIMVLPVW